MASHIYKLAVHKSKDVETMANYFENTPKYTKWTPTMTLRAGFWGFVVPYALYQFVLPAYNWSEHFAGKNQIDYSQGADVITEYGQGADQVKRSKYTSL
jgi:hypothetical protein